MMTCCEFCGIGDDLDNMYNAKITGSNGNETTVILCEGCVSSNKNLKDVIAISTINKVLNKNT